MFNKILVPLDGSELAECALSFAEELVKRCSAEEIALISVTERVQGYRFVDDLSQPLEQRLVPEAFGKKEKQAQRYLNKIANRLTKKGIKVTTDVLLWPPAEAIVCYAEQYKYDLIIMSSHGRSGPSRWAYGSVADKVFRASCIPVMMIKAPGCPSGV